MPEHTPRAGAVPAAPQHVQRGAAPAPQKPQKAAPVPKADKASNASRASKEEKAPGPQRREKQKWFDRIQNPILRGIVMRLFYLVKIPFKFALLVPILYFMVRFSYEVDRSGLFQGALAPRHIVDLMLQGYDVTNFESMDERQVVQLYAQDVPETPRVIGIGSSRVLQFNRELVGDDSFFNMGVTGADVRDCMTSYYKMVTYGKVPQVLLWSVDPWVFHGTEDAFDARADADLYNEFLTKVLNVPTDYEEPDKVELWKALVDPAYFQGNVDYYLKNRGQTVITDEDGNEIDFRPVEGDPMDQTSTIKRSDGSVLYDTAFRNETQEEILAQAAGVVMTFNSVHMEGFDAMSDVQMQAFDSFIRYARSQGTTVILVLSPWHPYLYDGLLADPDTHRGFFQTEAWIRQYCADNNVPLYGSYDPALIDGIEELDFFDGLHCKDTGIRKFFPGVPAVLQAMQNGTLPDPLAVSARTPQSVAAAAAAAAQAETDAAAQAAADGAA